MEPAEQPERPGPRWPHWTLWRVVIAVGLVADGLAICFHYLYSGAQRPLLMCRPPAAAIWCGHGSPRLVAVAVMPAAAVLAIGTLRGRWPWLLAGMAMAVAGALVVTLAQARWGWDRPVTVAIAGFGSGPTVLEPNGAFQLRPGPADPLAWPAAVADIALRYVPLYVLLGALGDAALRRLAARSPR